MSCRVRFAPSPTGFLHIGGARTALFNWLYARHMGGCFVLRIEDTDAARSTQEAVDVITEGLRWLGLDWDEGPVSGDATQGSKGGHGPYFQSQRQAIYQRRARELIDKGLAYEQDGVVRFRMEREPVVIDDLVVGEVRRELTDREAVDPNFVIVRSDGQPVFHLVNVVDDLEMGITHVIRGEDHLSNTPKHIALFRAFGVSPPAYAHIPLILNSNGTKMSKRDTGASLSSYIEAGYAPEGIVNYLSLLGWSPKDDREVLSTEEIIRLFDLPQIHRHNARFDVNKLHWINYEHIRTMPQARFNELARPHLLESGIDPSRFSDDYISAALATCKEKIKVFSELPGFADFYFTETVHYDAEAAQKQLTESNLPRLRRLREAMTELPEFNAEAIQQTFKSLAKELGVKVGVLVHPVRLACTGKTVGPSLYHLMEVLGRERVLHRLEQAIAVIEKSCPTG